jgi:hypothetical protein
MLYPNCWYKFLLFLLLPYILKYFVVFREFSEYWKTWPLFIASSTFVLTCTYKI